jgi:hypothetical protein
MTEERKKLVADLREGADLHELQRREGEKLASNLEKVDALLARAKTRRLRHDGLSRSPQAYSIVSTYPLRSFIDRWCGRQRHAGRLQ